MSIDHISKFVILSFKIFSDFLIPDFLIKLDSTKNMEVRIKQKNDKEINSKNWTLLDSNFTCGSHVIELLFRPPTRPPSWNWGHTLFLLSHFFNFGSATGLFLNYNIVIWHISSKDSSVGSMFLNLKSHPQPLLTLNCICKEL